MIYKIDNIEIIDSTPEAEIRLSNMEYTEERLMREQKRKRKNILSLWRILSSCGIL